MLDNVPDSFVYYEIPPRDDKKWDVDWVMEDPRVELIEIPFSRDRYKEYFRLRQEWVDKFAYWSEYWDWDVCLTTRAVQVPFMKQFSGKSVKKRFLILEPLPLIRTKKTVNIWNGCPEGQLSTLTGYILADEVYVQTKVEVDDIMQEARRYLSPRACEMLSQKLVVSFVMPEIDVNMRSQRPPWNSNDVLRVAYTQRLDKGERRPDRVFEVFQYTFVTTKNVAFEVMTNASTTMGLIKPFMRKLTPAREEYWERLKKTHVFMSWSLEEGMPYSLLEATLFGVIGVVKKEKWSKDFFGPEYPWLVANEQEGVAAIKTIASDYPVARDRWEKWFNEYFKPVILKRGDNQERLVRFMTELKEDHKKWVDRREIKPDELGLMLDERARNLDKSDIKIMDEAIRLSRWGKTNFDFETVGDKDWDTVPFARGTSLYETKLLLLHRYGWKDKLSVGNIVNGG